MRQKGKEAQIFVYLPRRNLLHSCDWFILNKQRSDLCGQSVSFGMSSAQVHESWERDRTEQATVLQVYTYSSKSFCLLNKGVTETL